MNTVRAARGVISQNAANRRLFSFSSISDAFDDIIELKLLEEILVVTR